MYSGMFQQFGHARSFKVALALSTQLRAHELQEPPGPRHDTQPSIKAGPPTQQASLMHAPEAQVAPVAHSVPGGLRLPVV